MTTEKNRFSFWRSSMLMALVAFGSQAMSQTATAQDGGSSSIWWLAIGAMAVLLVAIAVLGTALVALARVDMKKTKGVATLILLMGAFSLYAQEQPAASESSLPDINIIWASFVLLAELLVVVILSAKVIRFSKKLSPENAVEAPVSTETPYWMKFAFAVAVVASIWYMGHIYFMDMPEKAPVAAADAGPEIDENNVALADAAGIGNGKTIYDKNCAVCHGAAGEGTVGPNLTDDYWLHGGSIHDIFKTVKYGVVEKGMISWKDQLSATEMQDVTSYIKASLHGTNPANGKAPEGEVYKDESSATAETAATNAEEGK